MENTNTEVQTKEVPTKKSSGADWLLWWRIGDEELQRQVNGYTTLGVFKSARGMSLLFTILSFIITLLFVLYGAVNVFGMLDVIILVIFGIFIYFGHPWAAIAAMILWTIEKAITLFAPLGIGVTSIIWWAIYMHAFFLAYKVEKARSLSNHAA